MNAQELYHALTTLSKIPVGSKEQRMLALLFQFKSPVTIQEIINDFGSSSAPIRSLLYSLRDKRLISVGSNNDRKMTFFLSPKGKSQILKALNPQIAIK